MKRGPERPMCKAVNVRLELQWGPLEFGNPRNVRYSPMVAGVAKAKKEASGTPGVEHVRVSPGALNVRHGVIQFGVCHTGLDLVLFLHFLATLLLLIFEMKKFTLCHCILEI